MKFLPWQFKTPHCSKGFTLTELVIVIVLVGILFALGGRFIINPIKSHAQLERSAELVDQSEMAMRLFQRDVRAALPFSIRIGGDDDGNVSVIEMVNILGGISYRDAPTGVAPDPAITLDFSGNDTSFNTVGAFTSNKFTTANLGTVDVTISNNTNVRLVINHWGDEDGGNPVAGKNIYNSDPVPNVPPPVPPEPPGNSHVATPPGKPISIDAADVNNEHRITIGTGGHQFGFPSERQRLYVVDRPIAYRCDTGNGTLTRYANYAWREAPPDETTVFEGDSDLVANNLASCTITFDPDTALVTLDMTTSIGDESVQLMHQFNVVNAP